MAIAISVGACGGDQSARAAILPTPQSYAETCRLEPQACEWEGPGAVPDGMRRPLRHPRMGRGGTCPATSGARFRSAAFSGTVLGRGPVRPLVTAGPPRLVRRGVITFERGANGWWGAKTLWFAARRYSGSVLIRGVELRGEHPVAFGEQPAALARELPPGVHNTVNVHDGLRQWPGSTWVRDAGCYAWQVDGTSFSETIVFKARLSPT